MAQEWLHRWLEVASPYALAVNVPYALAFTLVAGEVAWLARGPGPARAAIGKSAATATTMAAGALAVGVGYTAALRFLWRLVAGRRWETAASFWHRYGVIGAAVTFVAWDFSGWVYHLIGHRTRIGWAAHQPHHSGQEFDATLGLRQSWAPFHGLVHQPLLALAGFDLRVVVVCAAVSNCWQVLEHTSLPVRFPPWFEAHVMTPSAHRHHHGRDAGAVNMGPVFTWWDRLAGTWLPPRHPAPTAYGPPPPERTNPFAIELAGWVTLAQCGARRARTNMVTCAATMAGAMNTPPKWPLSSTTSEPRHATASRARMAIHQPRARREPRPARGARTKPNTTTTIDTASPSAAMRRTSSREPKSIGTASASTCTSPRGDVQG